MGTCQLLGKLGEELEPRFIELIHRENPGCHDQSYATPCRRYKALRPNIEGTCPRNASSRAFVALILANGSNPAPSVCVVAVAGGGAVHHARAPFCRFFFFH